MIELPSMLALLLPAPSQPCLCAVTPFANAYEGFIFVIVMRGGPDGCHAVRGEWRPCPMCGRENR